MTFLYPTVRLITLLKFFRSLCLYTGIGATILDSSAVDAEPNHVQLRWYHQYS